VVNITNFRAGLVRTLQVTFIPAPVIIVIAQNKQITPNDILDSNAFVKYNQQ
jgi:hypothetical protein